MDEIDEQRLAYDMLLQGARGLGEIKQEIGRTRNRRLKALMRRGFSLDVAIISDRVDHPLDYKYDYGPIAPRQDDARDLLEALPQCSAHLGHYKCRL